jgi:hypothetical protein
MPRRAAQFTQAEIDRVFRAAEKSGAAKVVIKFGETEIVWFASTAEADKVLAPTTELDEWLKHHADAIEGH